MYKKTYSLPVYKQIKTEEANICIWSITESLDELTAMFETEPDIKASVIEQRKKEWLASRLALKSLLPNGSCQIDKNEYGKPFLLNSKKYISLSHTKDYAVAILSNKPVGIDIEKIQERIERIAKRFVHSKELPILAKNPRLWGLYLIWGAKEAMFKLYGKKAVDFKNHIQVKPLVINQEGVFELVFHKGDTHQYNGNYLQFNAHFMVWI